MHSSVNIIAKINIPNSVIRDSFCNLILSNITLVYIYIKIKLKGRRFKMIKAIKKKLQVTLQAVHRKLCENIF